MGSSSSAKQGSTLIPIVIILAIGILAYKEISGYGVNRSSILFIGLPALLAILVSKYSAPTEAYGFMFKVITIFLLISGMFLGEGVACILFAAPIFYFVGFLIILMRNYFIEKDKGKLSSFAILPMLFLLAQISDYRTPSTPLSVEYTKEYSYPVNLEEAFNKKIVLAPLPTALTLGFPVPRKIEGIGASKGDFRKITFESQTKGLGTLHLEIVESEKDRILLRGVTDDTHIGKWMKWNEVEIIVKQTDVNNSILVWKTDFNCKLGPSWYFAPLQKLVVKESTKYLVDIYFGASS